MESDALMYIKLFRQKLLERQQQAKLKRERPDEWYIREMLAASRGDASTQRLVYLLLRAHRDAIEAEQKKMAVIDRIEQSIERSDRRREAIAQDAKERELRGIDEDNRRLRSMIARARRARGLDDE